MFDVELPKIFEKKFVITDFGAKAGGKVSCTKAINAAIDEAAKEGGTVVIPAGFWLTGPIHLKSNVNLYSEKGALITFSKSKEEYPLFLADYEGMPAVRTLSPIYARDAENVAITGYGIFDGNGEAWRPLKKWKVTDKEWDRFLKKSQAIAEGKECPIWWPSESALEGSKRFPERFDVSLEEADPYWDYFRPVMVSLVNCKKVLIEGVTIQNSPAWNTHPLFCEDVTIRNATIRNPFYAQNGDGMDIESCNRVHIHDVVLAVGDDGICIKSGKNAEARKIKKPTEQVYIHDCIVYHAHGGFVVGSEMSRGVRDIKVENCTFVGTDVGLRFKSTMGRGGVVENIDIDGIVMKDIIGEAVIMTMGYQIYQKEESQPFTEEDVPEFKNINIKNVSCNKAHIAVKIQGLEKKPVRDITFTNCDFGEAEVENFIEFGENIVFN